MAVTDCCAYCHDSCHTNGFAILENALYSVSNFVASAGGFRLASAPGWVLPSNSNGLFQGHGTLLEVLAT